MRPPLVPSIAVHGTLPDFPTALVVGDVHGCVDELTDLLQLVGDPHRKVIFVGDLVAKGPSPREVLQRVRSLSAASVRGNHDQHYLNFKAAHDQGTPWPVHRETQHLKRFSAEDWAMLESLPHSLRIRVGGEAEATLVVHGGVVPELALEEQETRHLMNLRSLRADGSPSKAVEGTPWIESWAGPGRVVFGHDALRKLQRAQRAFGLDTGCVYGGALTGLLLPEEEIVSVPARRVYLEPG